MCAMKSIVAYSLIFAVSLVSALPLQSKNSDKYISLSISHKKNSDFSRSNHSLTLGKRESDTVPVDNDFYSYQVDLTVGNPGQPQTLILDTGSSDLWVYDRSVAQAKQNYDPSKSYTYHYNNSFFNIQYIRGSAFGDWVTDEVTIGNSVLENQSFGDVKTFDWQNGILGVGLIAQESSPVPYVNVPQNLVNQGYIDRNVYSLFLESVDSSSGGLLFGAVDSEKYTGPFRTVDLTRRDSFAVAVTDIFVGSDRVPASFDAVLDSGTSFTYLPWSTVLAIARYYGATWDFLSNTFVVRNFRNVPLTYDFGGIRISVDPSELFFKQLSYNGQYGLAVFPNDQSSGVNLLGDTFLRSAYVVFDLDRHQISLAQSSFNSGCSNIIPVTGDVPGAIHV